ncbi:unannotated protein [freshwater metagenome]|uniref:Unannotated protein n=1 Tax=freshwater metagenome TaxID=449393 RepID=A0A6J6RZC8_9ZZZZ
MLEPVDPHARGALRDHERLDRSATQLAVQRRPDDDVVGAVTGGDVDLLAVDDVLVAVERGRRLDVRRVGAGAGLGDGHAGPDALEALELLVVGHGGDGGVAQALARHREQQTDVTPAHLGDRHHRGEVGAVLDAGVAVLLVTADAGGAGTLARAGLGEPVDHRGEHVELLGVLVLGEVVLAGDRSQHVHRDLVGLLGERAELLGIVEVDHRLGVPSGLGADGARRAVLGITRRIRRGHCLP